MRGSPLAAQQASAAASAAAFVGVRSTNWVPLSVNTVWMRYGTAATRAWRKSAAIRRVARSCNCAKANLEVRSPPGPAGPVSFGDRISRLLAADGDEQIEPPLLGMHLGNIQVKEADRVGLEAGALGLRAVRFRQASNAVALQAAVQRGAGQVRQGRLQGVEAVVERQERVAPQRDDDRLVLGAQHGGPRRLLKCPPFRPDTGISRRA